MTHVTYAVLREDVMRQTSFTPETVRLLFLCGQVDVAKLFEMKPGTKEAVAFGEVEGREGEMGVGEVKGVIWDGVMGGVGKKIGVAGGAGAAGAGTGAAAAGAAAAGAAAAAAAKSNSFDKLEAS